MTDTPSTPTTFPEETDVTAIHAENPEELQMHSNNYRSVIPTDTQALTALQNLISDDFQAEKTHSTQRKGEKTPDTCSIQRKGEDESIPTNPEDPQSTPRQSNGIFKDSQSMHKYRFLILQTPGKYSSRFPVLQIRINILNPLIH